MKEPGPNIGRGPEDPPSPDSKSKSLLTKREREVLELLIQDKTTKEIAEVLFISEKTVRNHISNVMKKLKVKGRSQAIVELVRMGEIHI